MLSKLLENKQYLQKIIADITMIQSFANKYIYFKIENYVSWIIGLYTDITRFQLTVNYQFKYVTVRNKYIQASQMFLSIKTSLRYIDLYKMKVLHLKSEKSRPVKPFNLAKPWAAPGPPIRSSCTCNHRHRG